MIDDAQLAKYLLTEGIASQEQLQRGLQLRKINGKPLYEVLIENALMREEDVVDAAANILSQPCVHLTTFKLDPQVTGLISSSMARRNNVLPLAVQGEDAHEPKLILAMLDPLDIMVMDEISTHTSMDIHPVLAGPRDLLRAIERAYQAPAQADPDLDDPFASLGPLPQIDHDQEQEDSWADFFDSAQEPPAQPESADISREMRNRPSSGPFDAVPQDARKRPIDDSEPILDLGDWELDEPAQPSPPAPQPLPAQPQMPDIFGQFLIEDEDDAQRFSGTFIAAPGRGFSAEVSSVAKDDPQASSPNHTVQVDEDDIDDIFDLGDDELDAPPMPVPMPPPAAQAQRLTNALLEDSFAEEAPVAPPAPLKSQISALQFSLSGPKAPPQNDKLSQLRHKLQLHPSDVSSVDATAPLKPTLGEINSSFAEDFAKDVAQGLDLAIEQANIDPERTVETDHVNSPVGPNALGRLQLKKRAFSTPPLGMPPIVEKNSHREAQEPKEVEATLETAPAIPIPQAQIIEAELAFESSEYDLIEHTHEPPAPPLEQDILAAFLAPSDPETVHYEMPAAPEITSAQDEDEAMRLARQILETSEPTIRPQEISDPAPEDLAPEAAFEALDPRQEQATAANPALTVEYIKRMAHPTGPGPSPAQQNAQTQAQIPPHLTDHQLIHGLINLLINQGIFTLDEIIFAAERVSEAPSVSMDKLLEISKRFDSK